MYMHVSRNLMHKSVMHLSRRILLHARDFQKKSNLNKSLFAYFLKLFCHKKGSDWPGETGKNEQRKI